MIGYWSVIQFLLPVVGNIRLCNRNFELHVGSLSHGQGRNRPGIKDEVKERMTRRAVECPSNNEQTVSRRLSLIMSTNAEQRLFGLRFFNYAPLDINNDHEIVRQSMSQRNQTYARKDVTADHSDGGCRALSRVHGPDLLVPEILL